MFYGLLSSFAVVIAAVAAYFGLRILARSHWLLGWLRGMFGLLLLVGAVLFVLVAFDIFSYRQILQEKPVATLSFEQLGEQHYRAVIVETHNPRELSFELRGDQWQLDARVVKWKGFVAAAGVKPGYRLDRLGGRYYSLEKERTAERTVHGLSSETPVVDVWGLLRKHPNLLPLADASYGSATFVPMADGAIYEVTLSHTGLLARPLNDRAQAAVNAWQ